MQTFHDMSVDAIKGFLNSVVVVDDRAFEITSDAKPTILAQPSRRMATKPTSDAPAVRKSHLLDAKKITMAFAEQGLICSVLEPSTPNEIPSIVHPAADNADIIVLDWQLLEDDREKEDKPHSIQILEAILVKDEGNRRRFICIYTGENGLDGIAQDVKRCLERYGNVISHGKLFFSQGATTVSIYAKRDTKVLDEFKDRVVLEEELPQRLVAEFSEVTRGILPNALLVGLAAIRRSTHKLITQFSERLDRPFISHRIFSDPMEDVENHVAPLIASEVQSIIEQSDINKQLGAKAIGAWAEYAKGSFEKALLPKCTDEILLGIVKHYINNGASVAPKDDLNLPKVHDGLTGDKAKKKAKFTRLIGAKDPEKVEQEFAALTSLVTLYEKRCPVLRPGTIITDGGDYYLCIMPACDCLRIKKVGRTFPFLKMTSTNNGRAFFVKDGGEFKPLNVSLKAYDLRYYDFTPDTSPGEIVAKQDSSTEEWRFLTKGTPPTALRWVADLKPAHAQNIINAFAAQIARVGLTESEWLRQGKPLALGGNK